MGLTPEGELYLAHARRILVEIDDLAQLLGASKALPTGLLRVNATLGFGRSHAVYPQRHQLAARVRAFVDFVALQLPQQATAAR